MRFKSPLADVQPTICRLLPILLRALVLLLLTAGLCGTLWVKQRARGGFPEKLPPLNPQTVVSQLGVNTQLDQYSVQELQPILTQIRRAGFFWVRQAFPWSDIEPQADVYDWELWDGIVEAVTQQELQLIAVLDTSPNWAREKQDGDRHSPPQNAADYGRFTQAFATRYGDRIDYYQIWDEPNLSYRWGRKAVDATAYTHLLQEGAIRIRSVDSAALILTAGLAPTVETGPLNVNAPTFLEGIYAAGGAPYFDIVAVKCYGFQHDAWDRRLELRLLNFSRVQFLRKVIERKGDAVTPIWGVEFGWNHLPKDWMGKPSPWKGVGADDQIRYTLGALDRAEEEWPWMGAMMLSTWQPDAPPGAPVWGFALMDREDQPEPLLQHLQMETAPPSPIAHVGRYPPHHPTGSYEGQWQLTPERADIGSSGDRLTIHFHGTRLDLTTHKGPYWALLYVTVDGEATDTLPHTDDGRSYLVLYNPEPRTVDVNLARYLPDGNHSVEIVADGGWSQWAIGGWSVYREPDTRIHSTLQTIFALGLLTAILWMIYSSRRFPWAQWIMALFKTDGVIPPAVPQLLTVICAALFYFAPSPITSITGLVILALSLFWVPRTGLPVVTLAIPFYRQPKQIMGKAFSMIEVVVLVTLAAWIMRQVVTRLAAPRDSACSPVYSLSLTVRRWWYWKSRLSPLDWGMIALGLIALASFVVAQERGVALRELRTVVLEPLVFYMLLRVMLPRESHVWRVVDAWVLSGLAIAIWALLQFVSRQGGITAEGVWRVRGPYGSPNNLAIMLGRQLPLMTAVAGFGHRRFRRLAYALIIPPVVAALYLTYSRAGWLIGLPLPFVFLSLMRGGRTLWVAAGVLLLGMLSTIPILGTERFRSFLNTQQGTLFFRIRLWKSSLNMIRDHPLLGVGLDNFLYQYRSRYILPSAWQEPNLSHPHNLLIEFWTRLGGLGVSVLIWIEFFFFQRALRLYNHLPEGDRRTLVLGIMGGMLNVLCHGLVDSGFFTVDLAYSFCLLVGVTGGMGAGQNKEGIDSLAGCARIPPVIHTNSVVGSRSIN